MFDDQVALLHQVLGTSTFDSSIMMFVFVFCLSSLWAGFIICNSENSFIDYTSAFLFYFCDNSVFYFTNCLSYNVPRLISYFCMINVRTHPPPQHFQLELRDRYNNNILPINKKVHIIQQRSSVSVLAHA